MDLSIHKKFKALGEPTRLKILKMLSIQSMCVCELSEILEMLQPRVSQHLKVLKEADLVQERREGYWVYYSINKDNLQGLFSDLKQFLTSDLSQMPSFQKELDNLNNMPTNEKLRQRKKENMIIEND
ncbi:ArsR family transcriptional regulator [Desulfitispora alkaliphila]|uniref:ArsR/SmtB family transcription factor n=1 Tax=Desulfitispora alkaliphila TaxID=622674 RepID=UPI003D2206D4